MNLNPGEFAELLRQVRVGGDEDGPSLRVADYLEECGDHDRADLIRLMTERSPEKSLGPRDKRRMSWTESIYQLIQRVCVAQFKNSGNFRPGLVFCTTFLELHTGTGPGLFRSMLTWKRGLIESVDCNGPTWAALAETLTDNHPVQSVALSSAPQIQFFHDKKLRRMIFSCGNKRIGFDERDMVLDGPAMSNIHLTRLLWPEIEFPYDGIDDLFSQSEIRTMRGLMGLPELSGPGIYITLE